MPACCSACATAGGSRAILSWAATASAHHNHAAVSNRSARISERHHRVCGGHRCVPAELCAHRIAEDLRGIGFAVHYESLARRALKVAQPRQQPGLIGVSGEAADGVDLGPYRNVFAEDAHRCGAIDDTAAERSLRLKSGNHDSAFSAAEIMRQMMLDAAGIAHAARRNDQCAAADAVERLSLIHISEPT